MSRESPFADRTFVLGLDGVPWDRLAEWVDAGHLPAFARLFEEGASGPLRSTTPPTTALAWPSIATGVWPDEHGVYAFQKLTPEYTHRMYTADDVEGVRLWDRLTPAVVGNVPMTYPATEIDGKLVAGMLTPGPEDAGFAHPPSLGAEIRDRIPDYRIGLDWSAYTDRPEAFERDVAALLDARRSLLDLLAETPDWRLFFFVFTAPDRFQHLRWEEEPLRDLYARLDDVLADVLDYVESREATLFVVSDHGFGPVRKHVHVNTALARAGYLTRREEGATSLLRRLGVTRDRVQAALARVGIDDRTLVDSLPQVLVDAVASGVPGEHELYDVDYGQTAAFAHGEGSIYVNDEERFARGTVPADAVDDLTAELADLLGGLTDPETGERALTVYDGDDLFPRDPRAPDLVVDADRYVPKTSLAPETFQPTGHLAANHRHKGIFLAWGPNVRAGATPEEATVVDVAPTVLHAVGEPVPESTDGRVLEEVFAPGTPSATRERAVGEAEAARSSDGERAATDGEDGLDDVAERLRGLGYLE